MSYPSLIAIAEAYKETLESFLKRPDVLVIRHK